MSLPLALGGELRIGSLSARLAQEPRDVAAVQRLRYEVFYEEMSAQPSGMLGADGLDRDPFDEVADHLMVLDRNRGDGPEAIVGTYRLMRREAAFQAGRFYTSDEYRIECLTETGGELLELGRSCVHRDYRTKPTLQLLWRGLAAYVFHHDVEMLFGCACFPGVDPDSHAMALSYLHRYHLAPEDIRPVAVQDRFVTMDRLAGDEIDIKKALQEMPPLIKGYLRAGAQVGDGAVIDYQFGSTDVCIVLKTDAVTDKYFDHYQRRLAEPDTQPAS